MSDGFYLADEKHGKPDGSVAEVKNVLYFKLDKAGFDGKATKEHVKNYAAEYGNFKKANPSYKLPWGEDKDFVGVKSLEFGESSHTPVTERPKVNVKGKDGVFTEPGESPEELKKKHTDRDRPVK